MNAALIRTVAAYFLLIASAISLTSCSDTGAPVPSNSVEADSGTLSLDLTASDDIAGFQIDITKAGQSVYSQFVASDTSGASPRAERLVPLLPGSYSVSSTPMLSRDQEHPDCGRVTDSATVRRGRTTEVSLIARCSRGTGAIDVTTGVNFAPEFVSVNVDPSHSSACEDVTLSFVAGDAEGDATTCGVAIFPGSSVPVPAMPGDEPKTVRCVVHIQPTTGGEQIVELKACDPTDCSTLQIPLHVATGGACVPACDDGNPCTSNEHNPEGICANPTIPDGTLCTGGNLHVKLLGINDFHGQIEAGLRASNRPVGGAAVLASYLKAAQRGIEGQTILVHAGDHVGASPPASALLQDEPSISFLNMLANASCTFLDKLNPACNIVGTLGNHEFDEGRGELLRMLQGGNFPTGPFIEDPYPGARFPYVNANVVDRVTGDPLLRPFVVKELHGVKVGFIGAVLRQTPTVVTPTGVAGLDFLDEANAINAQVAALHDLGVHTLVVTIHQGGFQTSYTGPTRPASFLTGGPEIQDIVNRLDDDIDVVVSGHAHAFTNVLMPNAHGKPILVVQALSIGRAYDDIDLFVSPVTGEVVSKTAQVVMTWGDEGPGLTPDPAVAAAVAQATAIVAPLVNQVFGTTAFAFTRTQNNAGQGESTLGDLIADSQLAARPSAQFGFMNPGGIRADLDPGDITFGDLFTIQPFGNTLTTLTMTGAQIVSVLEQQWLGQTTPRILQIAGFDYTWSPARPVGSRIVEVRLGGVPINPAASYTVMCNNFLAAGGDGFTAFTGGTNQIGGPVDLDAIIEYVEAHSPLVLPAGNRIRTL